MARLKQFRVLLWKNWVLQKRTYCVTVFEVLLPLAFWGILMGLASEGYNSRNTIYIDNLRSAFKMDAAMKRLFGTDRALKILYTPSTTTTSKVMDHVVGKLNSYKYQFQLSGVDDEDELLREYAKNYYEFLAGVVFDEGFSDLDSFTEDIIVRLRLPPSRWHTDALYPRYTHGCFPMSYDYVYKDVFLPLQYAIAASLIELQTPRLNLSEEVQITLQPMPCAGTPWNTRTDSFEMAVPIILVLSYLLCAVQITKSVVLEKQRKLKMWLEKMGVRASTQWGAWFVKWFIQTTIMSVFLVLLGIIPLNEEGGSILRNTDPSLFLILLLCYSLALISFCFMISSFFRKATRATIACAVFFILFYLPYIAVQMRYKYISAFVKMAASLLFNVALGLGCGAIASYHMVGDKVSWSNFYRPPALEQDYSLLLAMIMLLIDSILYLLITWYVDGVFPGPNGVPRPWHFPFMKSYWKAAEKSVTQAYKAIERPLGTNTEFFQADPSDKEIGISVRGLRKVFGQGDTKKVAVDDMVFNVYKGHITALLGYNGAGKTTTLSMLTGFLPPTSGTATVDGHDINGDAKQVTQSVGLCPQDDILFDGLTVEEHLQLFSKLKEAKEDNSAGSDILDLGLDNFKNTAAGQLSGGQRRKLSVAIALSTSSKIVILDEPTSGMDPQSRRQVWSTLQRHKADKTILVTTHNMDEADAQSDRVAIMSEGVVKCSGSPMFLKNKFGVGYHLHISKSLQCDALSIKHLVLEKIPSAVECYNYDTSLLMTLPKENSSDFDKLFVALEEQKERLGVADFSVTFTTMEDVFLRVGRSDWVNNPYVYKQTENNRGDQFIKDDETANLFSSAVNLVANGQFLDFNEDVNLRTGKSLYAQQFLACLYKKYLLSLRNPFIFVVQILTTVALSSLAFGLTINQWKDKPARSLDINDLWTNKVVYACNSNDNQIEEFIKILVEDVRDTAAETVRLNTTNPGIQNYLKQQMTDMGLTSFSKMFYVGWSVEEMSTGLNITGLFSGESYHAVSVVLSEILNGLYKLYTGKPGIQFVNHPFPPTERNDGSRYLPTYISPLVIGFALGLLSSTFIVLILREKNSMAKHVQIFSGLKPGVFWLSTFTWDFLNMVVVMLVLMTVMAVFRVEVYASEGRLGYVFVVFLMFCWAVLPFTYLWTFLFRTPTCGFVAMLFINITFGSFLVGVSSVLEVAINRTEIMVAVEVFFSLICPHYAVGRSLFLMVANFQFHLECGNDVDSSCYYEGHRRCCKSCWDFLRCRMPQDNYLAINLPGVGLYVLIMFVQGIMFFLLTVLAENCSLHHKKQAFSQKETILSTEDDDVTKERTRIKADSAGDPDSLILHQLSRIYTKQSTGVDSLSLGVAKGGECFGLLGVNGAGKTTMIKILTGEDREYSGEAILNGFSISTNIRQVYGTVGYCPQRDALLHQFTGRETLTFFSKLKGIDPARISSVVDELLNVLYLEEHADSLTEHYSYGNKRKLSVAIALLADPQMLLLDEPTAGVDPVAKRRLWNVLADLRAAGKTIILTSHSMEECDAICTRLGIMVSGRLLCLGSPQHLKTKFGQGYTLTVRIKTSPACQRLSAGEPSCATADMELEDNTDWVRFQRVSKMVKKSFRSIKKIGSTDDTVKYCLLDSALTLSYVFRTLEEVKDKLDIADYSVNQSSLEDVFLHLSDSQLDQDTDD